MLALLSFGAYSHTFSDLTYGIDNGIMSLFGRPRMNLPTFLHQAKDYAMHIISRLEGQAVVVADKITVTVLEIDGDEVLLAIDGPDELLVERREELELLLASAGLN